MTWTLANASKSAASDAVAPLCNTGTIKIYTSPRPANPNTAITSQTLLATLTFSATAFGASSNGVATANAITSGTAAATGTAVWARVLKTDGTTVVGDCDVGTSGSDINFPSVSFVSGETISCSALTLTQP